MNIKLEFSTDLEIEINKLIQSLNNICEEYVKLLKVKQKLIQEIDKERKNPKVYPDSYY